MGITIWGWGSCGAAISIWGWGDYPCADFLPSVLVSYVLDDPYYCVPERSLNVCEGEVSDRSISVGEISERSVDVCTDDISERSGAVCDELSGFKEIC